MREAAADLEFETAARLRDEIKRLRETELAVADDPLTRQSAVDDRTGGYQGEKKYGAAANLPPSLSSGSGSASSSPPPRGEGSGVGGISAVGGKTVGGSSSRIATEYEPVQPTYAQSTSRVRKPTLDNMGPGTDRPVPARKPSIDPRAKAGAFGERIAGPHKPTLDEMGPHASLPVKSGKPLPAKPQLPTRTIEIEDPDETKSRRGRQKKTGRPGR
jgi:excinuclease ABC subunit B